MDVCIISTEWVMNNGRMRPAALDVLQDDYAYVDITGQQTVIPTPNVVVIACLLTSADRTRIDNDDVDHTLELHETFDDVTYGTWMERMEALLDEAS